MRITTSYQSMPAIWHAYDDDTYDGAEDAGPQLVGEGKTEAEAISDLAEKIRDDAYAEGQKDGQQQAREAANPA